MKITIEGDEDECRAAAMALAMGFQERHCPRVTTPPPETREEFLARMAVEHPGAVIRQWDGPEDEALDGMDYIRQ